jgi:hypothetical protein
MARRESIMKYKNIPLLVLSLSLCPCFYSVSNSAAETIVRTKAEEESSSIPPSTQPYSLTINRSTAIKTTEDPVNDYLQRGARAYPLPDDKDVILEELDWHDDFETLKTKSTEALQHKPAAMSYIGSIYVGIDEYEKAKPWLFAAAVQNNSDAFWLLASLLNNDNRVLKSRDLKCMEDNLLQRSASLGHLFAMDALKFTNNTK